VSITADDGTRLAGLWLEAPGPTISSVSGRVRTTADRYIVGTLQGENLRLATIAGVGTADTVSLFSGRVVGDSISGSYDARFGTTGPRLLRRQARVRP